MLDLLTNEGNSCTIPSLYDFSLDIKILRLL